MASIHDDANASMAQAIALVASQSKARITETPHAGTHEPPKGISDGREGFEAIRARSWTCRRRDEKRFQLQDSLEQSN